MYIVVPTFPEKFVLGAAMSGFLLTEKFCVFCVFRQQRHHDMPCLSHLYSGSRAFSSYFFEIRVCVEIVSDDVEEQK